MAVCTSAYLIWLRAAELQASLWLYSTVDVPVTDEFERYQTVSKLCDTILKMLMRFWIIEKKMASDGGWGTKGGEVFVLSGDVRGVAARDKSRHVRATSVHTIDGRVVSRYLGTCDYWERGQRHGNSR